MSYSNVTKLRIRRGGKVIYEGEPIATHDGGNTGPLDVELFANLPFSFEAKDQCSIGTLFQSIFRP